MKRYLLVIILMTAVFSSCKKFLAEKSMNEVVPTKTSEYGDLLAAEGYPAQTTKFQPQVQLFSDDIQYYNYAAYQFGGMSDFYRDMSAFQWQPDYLEQCRAMSSLMQPNFNSWKTYYGLIMGTNIALQYLDGSIGERRDKDWYKGQAYALRAYYYFMLVNLYALPYNDSTTTPDKLAGVPLKLDVNLTEKGIPRNTVKEVYEQVTKDIDSAIVLLEKEKRGGSLKIMNSVAAHLLASRIYLYMEDFKKAEEHANIVIDEHPALMDLNTFGGDMIMSNTNECVWLYGTNKEGEIYGMDRLAGVSQDLGKSYETTDLRSVMYCPETPEFIRYLFPPDYTMGKVTNESDPTTWRSSEAYLNRAEAAIQQYRLTGNAAKAQVAMADLNKLREKRYMTGTYQPWEVTNGDDMLKRCREERRRELCFEETHRWMDLRRYGMPEIKHKFAGEPDHIDIYTLKKRDPQYVLPIPEDVLLFNTVLLQNPKITGQRKPD